MTNDASGLAIESDALTKQFGRQTAVNAIDLAVPQGSVFGFLGPNGSGKTTSIRMLLGLVQPTSGTVRVLGERMPDRLHTVLPRVGALVEGPAFYPYLSGVDNLRRYDSADRFASSRSRAARIDSALERVGLSNAAHKRVHAYSLGMKQRLGLANALLRPRELLVLDEPTNGLDPQGTREVRNLVGGLAAEGITVFVSSHLLSEVAQMCTHAAVMSAGNIVAQGTLAELRGVDTDRVRVLTEDVEVAVQTLARLGLSPQKSDAGPTAAWVTAAVLDKTVAPEALSGALMEAGVRIRAFSVDEPSLEERFVALTGEGFDVVQ
ncbi:ATP-binding cassette domain-containing protein [Frigoribacterium sp. CG_9.8]|uniref:ABC transporter ATP-binding protein n=1 Tax=Frigoribacterium sp. CG_9.8 TaxID=2787733 RepID=UPI0018C9FA95|nr:ABC-2 type transport system ATP-binding protein [Frigoribacterium sp. CG_9.8]